MSTLYDPVLYATDRRTIIFVDAGFLLRLMQAHHQVDRAHLDIDNPLLVDLLREEAHRRLGCPVLRIYWYDAAHASGKVPNLLAAHMARVDGVRVRLGTLHLRPDGRVEQKAVDTLMVRDMIAHAYKKTAQEMILISGDTDLVPGLEEAQEQGVRVHLWSVGGDDLPPSVGRQLADLADSRHDIDAEVLARAIKSAPTHGLNGHRPETQQPAAPTVDPPLGSDVEALEPVEPPDVSAEPVETQEQPPPEPIGVAAVKGAVTPADLAAALSQPLPRLTSHTPDERFPRLYDLDREVYHAPVEHVDAVDVGREYAERWASAAGPDETAALMRLHDPGFDGNIPRSIDSDLLYFGADQGLDTYASTQKFALRRGFWLGVAARQSN